ncbi:chitosanase [Streptomyces sp. NPDC052043]|uniref:chitosanase n=1 Tax=Streptomyces sp. NPDC052043 TaxID=3365684 RepID=UPI0037D27F8C
MSRHLFGGGPSDFAMERVGTQLILRPGAVGTVWSATTNTKLTDLTDVNGNPITTVTADTDGAVLFYGPDGPTTVRVDFGYGRQYILVATDLGEAIDGKLDKAGGTVTGDLNVLGNLSVAGGSSLLTRQTADTLYEPKGPGRTAVSISMTGATTIPLPTGVAQDRQIHQVRAHAAGGQQRTATFDPGYLLTSGVTSRTVTVPAGQLLLAEAEYSALVAAWILVGMTITTGADPGTGGGGTGSKPTVSAGASTATPPDSPFTRTATENANGSTISSRSWQIITGPMGAGTTIGTTTALSWTPGSSPAGTTDIRQPVCQEMAFELTSTAENGTKDWTTAYKYIEDINDKRGYTAGLVGFVSCSGDMLQLVQLYAQRKPGNALASYISGLQQCVTVGYGNGASNAAATYLGTAFKNAWINAANTDPVFRECQRDMRRSMYWDDCLVQALADGVGPLGLAVHYDILINHGVGNDSESYGGIVAAARASTSKPPSKGGTEAAYLTKLCDIRDDVLRSWGDYQSDGRSGIFRPLISASKFDLTGTITWSVYGDSYSFNRPVPPIDARLGSYLIRYSATNSLGTSTSDITVTVNDPNGSGGGPGNSNLVASLVDNFDDNQINTVLWPDNYGSPAPTETGGRARVPCGSDYCAYQSASVYALAGSGAFIRMWPPEKNGAVAEAYASFQLASAAAPEGTAITISVNTATGKIRFSSNVDYWDDNAVSLTYDATNHAWLRIRETGGTLYWDTSANGISWTNRRTLPTPAWVTAAKDVSVSMEAHRDAGTLNYAEFDNLNVTQS